MRWKWCFGNAQTLDWRLCTVLTDFFCEDCAPLLLYKYWWLIYKYIYIAATHLRWSLIIHFVNCDPYFVKYCSLHLEDNVKLRYELWCSWLSRPLSRLKTEIDILQTDLRDWILRLICENVECCILCWLIASDWYKEACVWQTVIYFVSTDIFCIN